MIPKIIHWCWLSNDPLPELLVACIKTWKQHLPDYEIKCWGMKSIDIDSVKYVSQAVQKRKWAFAADYIRAYALYHEGGIYLDSDVFVLKNFDFVLNNRFFSAIESYPERIEKAQVQGLIDKTGNKKAGVPFVHGIQIQAAIIGAEKCHPFLKDCLEYYETHDFLDEEGNPNTEMISPFIFANAAEKYGFKYLNKEQELSEGMMIYSAEKFAPFTCQVSKKSYAIHCCAGSWVVDERDMQSDGNYYLPSLDVLKERLNKIMRANKFLKGNKLLSHANEGVFIKFLYYLSQRSISEYRCFLIKIALFDDLRTALKLREGVCYFRNVHTNFVNKLKCALLRQ